MTQVLGSALDEFRGMFTGQVIMPTDNAYDTARAVWNAEVDRHPAMIARCLNAADVSAAVIFARQQELEVSVRGGAHNTSGCAVGDGGLMIDLSQLRHVTVNPARRRAWVGGVHCWPIWTPPRKLMGWRHPPVWSATPVWVG
jgi:FAD binding domain